MDAKTLFAQMLEKKLGEIANNVTKNLNKAGGKEDEGKGEDQSQNSGDTPTALTKDDLEKAVESMAGVFQKALEGVVEKINKSKEDIKPEEVLKKALDDAGFDTEKYDVVIKEKKQGEIKVIKLTDSQVDGDGEEVTDLEKALSDPEIDMKAAMSEWFKGLIKK